MVTVICEQRDTGGPADALVPNRPDAYGFTDVLMPCSHAACPNMVIQQPGRGLHLDERREAHGLTDVMMPCSNAACLNTDIQQPGRGLHLDEQRAV